MESGNLFGGNITPSCKYCEFTMQYFDNDKILCEKRGVVLAGYKCRSFLYDPLKRVPKSPRVIEKIKEEEFAL